MEIEIAYSEMWQACPCSIECVRTPGVDAGGREQLSVCYDDGTWELLVTLEPTGSCAFERPLLPHACETLLDYLTWLQAVTTSIRVNGRPWLMSEDTRSSGCVNGRALWKVAESDPAIVRRALEAWKGTGIWPRRISALAGRPPEEVFGSSVRMTRR